MSYSSGSSSGSYGDAAMNANGEFSMGNSTFESSGNGEYTSEGTTESGNGDDLYYQTTTQTIGQTGGEVFQGESMGTTTQTSGYQQGRVVYSQPIIQNKVEQNVSRSVTRRNVVQPVITTIKRQQPYILQRVVKHPIKYKTEYVKDIKEKNINEEPIVKNNVQTKTVNVNVPGNTHYNQKEIHQHVKTINNTVNVNRGERRVINKDPITRETQVKNINKVRKVTVPAKEIYTQPIYQREVVNNSETVKFQRGEPRYETKETVTREPQYRTTTRTQTEQRPAAHYYTTKYIQPTVERNNVEVELNREEDKYVTENPVYLPTKHNHVTRTRAVTVPANQIIKQNHYQQTHHTRQINNIQVPKFYPVVREQAIPVPVPVIKRKVTKKYVPIPVQRKGGKGTRITQNKRYDINLSISGSSSSSYCSSDELSQFKSTSDSDSESGSSEEYDGFVLNKEKRNKRKYHKLHKMHKRHRKQNFSSDAPDYKTYQHRGNADAVVQKSKGVNESMSLPMLHTGAWNGMGQGFGQGSEINQGMNWVKGTKGWKEGETGAWMKGDGKWRNEGDFDHYMSKKGYGHLNGEGLGQEIESHHGMGMGMGHIGHKHYHQSGEMMHNYGMGEAVEMNAMEFGQGMDAEYGHADMKTELVGSSNN